MMIINIIINIILHVELIKSDGVYVYGSQLSVTWETKFC